jgi:hypothetical protein
MPHEILKKINVISLLILTIITLAQLLTPILAEGGRSVESDTRSRQTFTHTVFAEDITAEWCVYCPGASETLNDIYNAGYYDTNFYFVCMITQDGDGNVLNQDAQDRANELNIDSYPTVEFDGGYWEQTGDPQGDDSNYRDAIETCGARPVPDLEIDLAAQYNGDAEISIDVGVTNNDADSYAGTLRVYIVEIVSRYFDYDGNHYPYGFLDFAIDEEVVISSGSSVSKSNDWDGASIVDGQGNDYSEINPDNMIIFAILMNNDNIPFRERITQSSKNYPLYPIDEAAATYLSDAPPVVTDNDPPEIDIISPIDGSEVTGTVKIEAEVDDDSSITKVEYQIDTSKVWTQMFDDEFDDYFRFWDTKYVSDGTHTLTVRAFDSRNNIGTESVDVIVKNDFEDPKVIFKNLNDNDELKDEYSINVQANDDMGIKNVMYRIDTDSWKEMEFKGNNEYSITIDTTTLSDGSHDIAVRAEDLSGKTATQILTFKVKNKADTTNESQTPGFELLILISVMTLVTLLLSRSRKFRY